jgi:hypothetical protein
MTGRRWTLRSERKARKGEGRGKRREREGRILLMLKADERTVMMSYTMRSSGFKNGDADLLGAAGERADQSVTKHYFEHDSCMYPVEQ